MFLVETSLPLAAPAVSFVAESNAGTSAGIGLTVSGLNFGLYDNTPSSRIGASGCGTAAWVSLTSVQCVLQHGLNVRLGAAVTVSEVAGTFSSVFSFDGDV